MKTRFPIACEPHPSHASRPKQVAALQSFKHRLALEIEATRGRGREASARRDALHHKHRRADVELRAIAAEEAAAMQEASA
jgi:hypothetical protein